MIGIRERESIMYAVTVSMKAKSIEEIEALRSASLKIVASSLSEPGCLFFDVLFDDQDPLVLRFYEAYVDQVSFEAHLNEAHTKRWTETCIPLVDRSTIQMPESLSNQGSWGDKKVAVFGATGKIGSEMTKLLAMDPRCTEVLAITRDPDAPSARRLSHFGDKVRAVNLDLDQLHEICRDVTDVFLIAPLVDEMRSWHEQVAHGLSNAQVEHVVKVSVTGARSPKSEPPPGRFPSLHWAGEEALREAGLKVTVIRPTIFMQHFEMGTGIYERADNCVYLPIGDAGVAFLDCRDIAAMAHALILNPKASAFHGGAYELTGPEAITGQQIAAQLTAVRGEEVRHIDGEEAFITRCAELNKPDWGKAVYAEAAGGWFSELSIEAFKAVVGRLPRSFAAYIDDRSYWFR